MTAPRLWSGGFATLFVLLLGLSERAASQAPPARDTIVESFTLHVPAQCNRNGSQCPLVVVLRGMTETDTARWISDVQQSLADQSGMLLLIAKPSSHLDVPGFDTVLPRLLHTYPIDPAKLALVSYGAREGQLPQAPFSRFALLAPLPWGAPVAPPSPPDPAPAKPAPDPSTVRVYLAGGLGEEGFARRVAWIGQTLQDDGYAVDVELSLRGYQLQPADVERVWRWLSVSWTAPARIPGRPGARAGTRTPALEPGPLLTPQSLRQLTAFWTRFLQLPDSIRTTARLAHQRQHTGWDRTQQFALWLMDTPALAVRYPAVQTALRAAGLTAQQADADRWALVMAAVNMTTWSTDAFEYVVPVTNARLRQNIAFMAAQKDALKVLGATGMWTTP